MALQLLLEASSGVSAMKSVESACIFDGQRMTVMILPHSVVFVNVCPFNSGELRYCRLSMISKLI